MNRRDFLALTAVAPLVPTVSPNQAVVRGMRFGLVTYLWGQDWDLPTLIRNCEAAGYAGVELRTQHAHRVEPGLSPAARAEVRRRFADSPVVFVGYGSNQEFHSPDAAELRRNIEGTFELIKLCHDLGAFGVKVKPNTLPDGVPAERTIDQIARALNEIGRYAADYGQVIRLEVHGHRTSELPVIKQIMDRVTEKTVGLCWNCNPEDLLAPGLEANFRLVRHRFGDTLHVRELDSTDYPYPELMRLLVQTRYQGWVLLEARTSPADRVAAMRAQLELFRTQVGGA